jgi:hypothetical protein
MKTRFVIAVVVIGLALAPVVLSIGALVLVPLALVLLPVAVVLAIAALPWLAMLAARGTEPGVAATQHASVREQTASPAS